MRRKNATGQRRYCHVVVSSWVIKHFDFQVGLWLANWLINNHVRIYGSNVAEDYRRSNVGLVCGKIDRPQNKWRNMLIFEEYCARNGHELHPAVSVGYNYLSLPLVPDSGTTLLISGGTL